MLKISVMISRLIVGLIRKISYKNGQDFLEPCEPYKVDIKKD